jgi:alanyl-tRNA synthetase
MFLEYYKRQGHEVVASSPLVPGSDPAPMFTTWAWFSSKPLYRCGELAITSAQLSCKCVRMGEAQ